MSSRAMPSVRYMPERITYGTNDRSSTRGRAAFGVAPGSASRSGVTVKAGEFPEMESGSAYDVVFMRKMIYGFALQKAQCGFFLAIFRLITGIKIQGVLCVCQAFR